MKVVIITQCISPIIKTIINSSHKIVGITESSPREKPQNIEILLREIVTFFSLIIKKEPITLKSFSEERGIPYYYLEKGNNKQFENWIKNLDTDLIIINSMSHLLRENIFNIPKYGAINLHSSLLPKYRGPNPWFWIYYNFDSEAGVTVFYIDNGEDTGDIIFQKKYNVPFGAKLPDIQNLAINKIGAKLLLKAINHIEKGTAPRVPQPKESPTQRARNIKLEEHKNIINWKNWTIERIWHILRGTEDWLNALEQPKGLYKGQRWKILNFKKCDIKNYITGKIYKENDKYFVICRDGKIYLDLRFSLKKFIFYLLYKR